MISRQSYRGWWKRLSIRSRTTVTFWLSLKNTGRWREKALGAELDRLILDMKTGNQEAALRGMDARLGLPSFAALCSVLCGVHQGVDQSTSLLVLEQDMQTKEREALRRLMGDNAPVGSRQRLSS